MSNMHLLKLRLNHLIGCALNIPCSQVAVLACSDYIVDKGAAGRESKRTAVDVRGAVRVAL